MIMEALAVVLVGLVVGAVGVWLGILVAPAIGRLADWAGEGPDDEEPKDEEPDDGR